MRLASSSIDSHLLLFSTPKLSVQNLTEINLCKQCYTSNVIDPIFAETLLFAIFIIGIGRRKDGAKKKNKKRKEKKTSNSNVFSFVF